MSDLFSLNQLIAQRVRESPDLDILAIPDKDFNYVKYSTSEIDAAASLLANHLRDTGALPGRAKGDAKSRLTVGLLGVSNFEYVVAEIALYRMGYCVLFISPNNSPAAIAHLLTVTNSSHLLVQDTLVCPATEARALLADPLSVSIIRQPPSDVFGPYARAAHPDKTQWESPLSPEAEHLLPVNIIHSSGSTGFPKPITTTNKAAVGRYKTSFAPVNITSLTTFPLYHTCGQSNFLRAWYAAKPLYLFPTASIPLTSANIIKILSQTADIKALYGVPLALKLLAETPESTQVLKRLELVVFGGSSCPDELGDFLVSQGVPLIADYGMTETGQLLSSFRDFDTDRGWNWLRAKGSSGIHKYLHFEPHGNGTYELHVLDGWPAKAMSNQPDGSYATRDLFVKHPTIPDAYKHIGRVDDTLVMVNGEKTNPVPIELKLRSSPYIADAIVFGSGRAQIGALILPAEAAQHFAQEEFTRHVASAVALANAEAPSHSQLSTEALVFLPYGTRIPRADKGSILRPKVYKEFENIIGQVYECLEGEAKAEERTRVEGEVEARAVVRELIGKTIKQSIDRLEDDTDLFDFGLDSLQSSRIRNAIQREIDLSGKKLSINVVFEHPSITKLAKFILSISSGKDGDVLKADPEELMLELINKYGNFPYTNAKTSTNTVITTSGKVVVLTGATGSLGSYVLDELLADPEVETVYCLCRAENDVDAADRLMTSMKTRKLLERFSSAHTAANERVVTLATDLSAIRLGLGEERYYEIANRATVIIHNAWAVNFNLGISSFETHIRGTANLIHLALSSSRTVPAKFFFASSISTVLNWPGPESVPEAVTDNPAFAQGTGYSQSKWIAEKLCQIAARTTPIQTAVLRIGQLVGDTKNGVWNESEGISLIIKCADTIGILPELDEEVSWLPADYAAKSIVELVNLPTSSAECPVYHVLNPTRITWSSLLAALETAHLDFKPLSRQDWLKALRASDPDGHRNPSRKLLSFYESEYGGEKVRAQVGFSVDKTVTVSRWLREAPVIGRGLVAKWVGAWRGSGFLRC